MMRKKNAMHLDSRYATMLENAYYDCNPPEVQKVGGFVLVCVVRLM